MQTKLLRKAKKRIRLVKRNNEYYIVIKYTSRNTTNYKSGKNFKKALNDYKDFLITISKSIFEFKYKKRIL